MVMLLFLVSDLLVFSQIVYRIWTSARMGQLEDWFRSWVHDSVFCAGGGRGSVEAWYTSALDIEEVLIGATDSHIHLFVANVIKSFGTVERGILHRVLSKSWFAWVVSPHVFSIPCSCSAALQAGIWSW